MRRSHRRRVRSHEPRTRLPVTVPPPDDAPTVCDAAQLVPDTPAPTVAPDPVPARCVSCETVLAGLYCHTCGERALPPGHHSLGRYLRDAASDLTNADGALWRSLRALVLRPGHLTREWLDGRRQPYVRPFRLFLVTNVAFFLLLSFAGGSIFRGQIESARRAPVTGAWAGERFEQAVAESGVSADVYTAAFNQHADTLSRTIIVLLVPLLAVVFGVVLGRRRYSAVAHLAFSTHFVTGMMVLSIVLGLVSLVLSLVLRLFTGDGLGNYSLDPFILAAVLMYLVLAVRRAYRLSLPAAIGTGVLGMAGLFASVLVFQFLLFLFTVWTLGL